MPILLDEEMIGLNADGIGYPNLLLCMGLAITYKDANGWGALAGMHLTSRVSTPKAIPLFVKELGQLGAINIGALYGSCNRTKRYVNASDPTASWKDEMREIAGALGFHGEVRGFDTGILAPKHGTYVLYEVEPVSDDDVRIYYKLNEEMVYGDESGPAVAKAMYATSRNPNDRVIDAKTKSSAQVKQGDGPFSRTRKLEEVNYASRLTRFNV